MLHGHRDAVTCGRVACPSGHVDVRTRRADGVQMRDKDKENAVSKSLYLVDKIMRTCACGLVACGGRRDANG